VFILDLAAAQARAGLDVHVLAPHDTGAATTDEIEGVGVRRFRYAPQRLEVLAYRGGLLANVRRPQRAVLVPAFLAGYRRAAIAEVRRLRPDVVHAHWWFPGGLVGLSVAGRTGAPLLVTLHGSDVHIAARTGLTGVARRVVRRADGVGAVSAAIRDDVSRRFGLDPADIPLLPMPIEVEPVGPWTPPAPPPLRLLAVGRLVPEKGFDVLIDAAIRLRDRGVDLTLDVVGDGPDAVPLATRARPLGDAVTFHGARSRADIAEHLATVHALVVPSRREGLGMVALEALHAGCPVVASAIGGLVEIVEDGDGILVPPEDVGALAAAIERLPLPAPRGEAAERHLPEAVAADHRRAYEQVIARARGA
jgi:glycosyltransferase involved in cell wall biosynthesis